MARPAVAGRPALARPRSLASTVGRRAAACKPRTMPFRVRRAADPQNTFLVSQSEQKKATKSGTSAHINGWIRDALPVATITAT
jgi:hypothetical protein